MRKLIILMILLLSLSNAKSQEKQIQGDTTNWYKWNKKLSTQMGLQDFSISKHDFDFRFWNQGQIIEIWKVNDSIQGALTNYIFWSKSKEGPLFEKKIMDSGTAAAIYQIINNSDILDLPTDKMINKWSQGLDGITYIIEHANNKNYWYKTYWTPSAQDSLKEALIVSDFVKKISNILDLKGCYKKFENNVPHKGCYNSGGISQKCYISNSYGIGYYGSTSLPIGYSLSLSLGYIGKLKTDFGLSIIHQLNNQGNYNFSAIIGKSRMFFRKNAELNDFLTYNYRQRKLNFINDSIEYQNHKIFYGLTIKNNFAVAAGVDYFKDGGKELGGLMYSSYWFSKAKLNISGMTSIFKNHIDYIIGLSRSFLFRQKYLIKSASIGLNYEEFLNYSDLNLSVSISL
jgi:hypothetical protein